MSLHRKAEYVLEQATTLARNVTTWADFSVAIFDQRSGLVSQVFDDPMEREAFFDSEQYKAINQLLLELMNKHGVEAGATPQKIPQNKESGRVLLRMPQSVHKLLKVEAKKEGVSLNQLAVAKLAVPLGQSLDVDIPLLVEAYTKVYDGYSTDRVVVDPDLDARFLVVCRKLGMTQTDSRLNHALMDIRKSKKAPLPKTTKRTEFSDYDQYQFASEIAVRVLQRTEGVTLDKILCDPRLALEFDRIAKELAPGVSALKLRWAALNLRKTHRLGPSKAEKKTPEFDLVPVGPLQTVVVPEIPPFPATYVFYDQKRPIFAGETSDLRSRIEKHLKGGLPRWLEASADFDIVLKRSIVPAASQDDRRSWLAQFINRERPLLNYQKAA